MGFVGEELMMTAKAIFRIEFQGRTLEVTAEGSGPLGAMEGAQRLMAFEIERRPGCTCDARDPADSRCDGIMMRCHGAILGSRTTKPRTELDRRAKLEA